MFYTINTFLLQIVFTLMVYCETQTILNFKLESRVTDHPLKVDLYVQPRTAICRISSADTNVKSIERLIFNEEVLDYDLCAEDSDQLGANLYLSDPNSLSTVMSLSLGNQSQKNRLLLRDGTLLLDGVIDFVLIELNELKLEISNTSMASKGLRHFKTISLVDINIVETTPVVPTEAIPTESTNILDFHTMTGIAMFIVIFVILLIVFCWKFQNS